MEIGEKIRFRPFAWLENPEGYSIASVGRDVTGTIIEINEAHRWYRVAYPLGAAGTGHECFKY
jgi:hypothetical protein